MFWKRSAGPPGFGAEFRLASLGGTAEAAVPTWSEAVLTLPLLTRSVISAISRMGSTSVWIRLSSPARSRAAIHWRRSSKGKGDLQGTDDYSGDWDWAEAKSKSRSKSKSKSKSKAKANRKSQVQSLFDVYSGCDSPFCRRIKLFSCGFFYRL